LQFLFYYGAVQGFSSSPEEVFCQLDLALDRGKDERCSICLAMRMTIACSRDFTLVFENENMLDAGVLPEQTIFPLPHGEDPSDFLNIHGSKREIVSRVETHDPTPAVRLRSTVQSV